MLLPRLIYFTFHGIGEPHGGVPSDERPYWLPVEVFRHAVAVIARLRRDGGHDVQLTIDDGNVSDLEWAVPVLEMHGLKAEIFVLTGRFGQQGSLSRAQVREISRCGFAIGSHGVEHLRWAEIDDRRLEDELRRSKADLEDLLGHEIDGAATPFGSVDARVTRHAMAAGYRRIHTSRGGYTWSRRGLVPRRSFTAELRPAQDIPPLLGTGNRFRALLRDPARRLRHETRLGARILGGELLPYALATRA